MINIGPCVGHELEKPREKWQTLTRCKLCKDVIYSRWEGEYRTCGCGSISVDQTMYYMRCVGDMDKFERVEEDALPKV
jgi:hypothetical protein